MKNSLWLSDSQSGAELFQFILFYFFLSIHIWSTKRGYSPQYLSTWSIPPSMIKDIFINESQRFDLAVWIESNTPNLITWPKTQSWVDEEIFGGHVTQSKSLITSKLNQYLADMTEGFDTHILNYWKSQAPAYPVLCWMARCYLEMTATSAPSERVFSKAKTVECPSRGDLSCRLVKAIVCLKDWYQVFATVVPL